MSKRRRLRFSLAGLLVLVTAAALVIGATQARRRSIVREADALADEGVGLAYRTEGAFAVPAGFPDGWRDRFWQRRPTEAMLYLTELSPDKFRVGDAILARRELIPRLLELEARARSLGVEYVDICADGTPPYTPSEWAFEINAMTDARVLACKLGDSTYEYIPGLPDQHKRR